MIYSPAGTWAVVETEAITKTTSTLLRALCESRDESAWREVDDRYRPIIVGFAQRLGLSPEDAADTAQETLAQFFADYRSGKYDRERGRLRAWMLGIARHRIGDVHRRQVARAGQRGASALAFVPDDQELSRAWDAEAQSVLLDRALGVLRRSTRVNERTCEAFRLHVIEQRPPEEVAVRLQMTVRSVYLAKHRCLHRLRGIVTELQAAYELE
jgi:RNA polymerase sigma-70 factor (ECF subfamily)